MAETVDINAPFRDVYEALDLKEQRKAMRSAMFREGNRLKKQAATNLDAAAIGKGTHQRLSKSIRLYVYQPKYGAGFEVTVKPHKKKGYHRRRDGKEKPVLMWAEDGTAQRKTKTATKVFVRKRKGHSTGRMRRLGFMPAEDQSAQAVEQNLFGTFQKNLERAAKKKGLL